MAPLMTVVSLSSLSPSDREIVNRGLVTHDGPAD